jgi:uncharacterized protein (DUF934 family)
MALIRHGKQAPDNWQLLDGEVRVALQQLSDQKNVIVPLASWIELSSELRARSGGVGVCLAGGDDPELLVSDFAQLDLIAVRFASFTDGRGYSTARLLRERWGWRGELRAVGDVQRDQLFYLARCGFDSFHLRDGEDVEAALGAFADFSEAYQTAVDRPVPLFRRRELRPRHP